MSASRPPTQPTMTRIDGGGSAHLAVIGLVLLLVALVWVGWSGRPAGPGPAVSLPPVADASESVAGPAASPPLPTATAAVPGPTPRTPAATPAGPGDTAPPSNQPAEDVYVVTAGFPGAGGGGMLREVEPGSFQAVLQLPSPAPDTPITLEMHQLSSDYVLLGTWKLSTDQSVADTPGYRVVLAAWVGPSPDTARPSLLARRGFSLEVYARSRGSEIELTILATLLPRIVQLTGDDGRLDPAAESMRLFVDWDRSVRQLEEDPVVLDDHGIDLQR